MGAKTDEEDNDGGKRRTRDASTSTSSSRMLINSQIILACSTCLLAGAAVFGWSSLEFVFKEEGVYFGADCVQNEECPSQTRDLNTVYLLGSTAATFAALPWGWLLDIVGPKRCASLALAMFFCGTLLCSFGFFKPGFFFVGLASAGMLLPCWQFSNATNRPGLYLAAMNGCYDASTLVLQVFLWLQNGMAEFSVKSAFRIYSVVPLILLIGTFILFPHCPYKTDQSNVGVSENGRSIKSVIFTKEWIYFGLFMTSGILRFSYYIGSVAAQVEHLSEWDETVAEDYVSLFGTMLPFGVFVTPIAGILLDKYGTSNLLWIVYAVIAVQGTLSTIISLPLQRASFITFIVFRSFFFPVVTKWCSEVFPTKHIGKAFGLASTVASMLTLGAQVLLFDLAASKDGSYLVPNIIVLCITSIVGLPLPLYWIWMGHDDGSAFESELAQI